MVGPPAANVPRCAAASTPRARPARHRDTARRQVGRQPERHFPGVRRAGARTDDGDSRRVESRRRAAVPKHGRRIGNRREPGRIIRRAERQRANATLRRAAQQERRPLPRGVECSPQRTSRGVHTLPQLFWIRQRPLIGYPSRRPARQQDASAFRGTEQLGQNNCIEEIHGAALQKSTALAGGADAHVTPCRGPAFSGGDPTPSCTPL